MSQTQAVGNDPTTHSAVTKQDGDFCVSIRASCSQIASVIASRVDDVYGRDAYRFREVNHHDQVLFVGVDEEVVSEISNDVSTWNETAEVESTVSFGDGTVYKIS